MFFQKSLSLNKTPELDNNFYLARIYHENYKFEKAIGKYNKFKDDLLKREEIQDIKRIDEISKLIEECESGKVIFTVPSKVGIENLSNLMIENEAQYSDYAVYSTSNDSLVYFTSVRSSNQKKTKDLADIDEDIYLSKKTGELREKAQNIGLPINTKSDDAIVGLSRDGNTMFIYSGSNNGDVYYAVKKGGIWSEPLVFSRQINSDASESSLVFSVTGDTLFFVSDRTGTYGKKDIFYSIKNGDDWGKPMNIGPTINTKYDEEGLFMDGDTLYFASKGHNTIGGYDIFKSYKIQNNQWSKPRNLLYPINSTFDDIFYSSNKFYTYFASNRDNRSCIYGIKKAIPPISPQKDEIIPVPDSTIIPIDDFFIINDIEFALESYINTDVYSMLNRLANYLISNPGAKIKISGFTDLLGNKNYNERLSIKRANFVKHYLLKKGVKEQSLVVEGNGWLNQISKNKNDKGKFIMESLGYNRRVEFKVLKQGIPKLIVQKIAVPDSLKVENTDLNKTLIHIQFYLLYRRKSCLICQQKLRNIIYTKGLI